MRKLMVYCDDYNELTQLEMLLRKVGFDVLTVQKESQIADELLGFTPDLALLITRNGPRDIKKLSQKFKRPQGDARLATILPQDVKAETLSDDQANLLKFAIERPWKAEDLLTQIAQTLLMDPQTLLEKFRRSDSGPQRKDNLQMVRGSADLGPEEKEAGIKIFKDPKKDERKARYEQFLKTHEKGPRTVTVDRKSMKRATQQLKNVAANEVDLIEDINIDKKVFVEALIKEGKPKKKASKKKN